MKPGNRPDFADLLAEAGGGVVEGRRKESSLTPEAAPLRTEDALSLSVQGRKALAPGKKRRKGECSASTHDIPCTDWQGNKVRLSQGARILARDIEEKVAWETRIERRRGDE